MDRSVMMAVSGGDKNAGKCQTGDGCFELRQQNTSARRVPETTKPIVAEILYRWVGTDLSHSVEGTNCRVSDTLISEHCSRCGYVCVGKCLTGYFMKLRGAPPPLSDFQL